MKLTFKEYLDSKEALREAIENTPVQTVEYTVKRYCKVAIGESKEERNYLALKPKQDITVKWKYININETPEPVSVEFDGEEYDVLWTGTKLKEWLKKNAVEHYLI